MFNISLLTIGDEILIGQTVNTNASWLGSEFSKIGANIYTHSTISDDESQILNEFDRLFQISDMIVVTGGLGPTHDDITKTTLCKYFSDELILNLEILNHLENLYKQRGRILLESNKLQAYLPTKCKVLFNSVGTAPGMLFEKNGKYLVAMPGVPSEMKAITLEHLLSLVKSKMKELNSKVKVYKTLLTIGIPESLLAEKIGDQSKFLDENSSLAYLPSYRGVKLRISILADSFQIGENKISKIEDIIRKRVGDYIISSESENIMEIIAKKLIIKNRTVSVAESCTGGLLGAALTELSGSSSYFIGGELTYSNIAKINQLGVLENTLNMFGAVSEETALEMASNVRKIHNTYYGLSITGTAGPNGGTPEKPVGTVWIGIATPIETKAICFIFGNNRQVNRELSVGYALSMLMKDLNL